MTNPPPVLLTKTTNNTANDKPIAGVVDKDPNSTTNDKHTAGVIDKGDK